MKYCVVKCVNGNYSIHTEGWVDKEKAIINYFSLCQTLHNAADVITACCAIMDENLDVVEGYKEYIVHPEPEPEPEPNEEP